MSRPLLRGLPLALLLALAAAVPAGAATVRTTATPAQLRAGKAAYEKAITAGYAKATRLLDAQLAKHPRKPVVVMDIDETTLSNWGCLDAVDFDLAGLATCVITSRSVAFPAARGFVRHARARRVAIAFITGAPQALCDARRKNLVAQGFTRFTITCKPATDTNASVVPFKSGARKALARTGASILLNIGDQKSDLAGGGARKAVRLPNPIYVTA